MASSNIPAPESIPASVPPAPLAFKSNISPQEFLISGSIMLSFTTLFVAFRVVADVRRKQNSLGPSIISIFSVLLLATFLGLSYEMNARLFTDPTSSLKQILLYTQVTNWAAALAMWFSKAPVLLLFIALFGVKKWLRYTSYAMLVLLGVAIVIPASITSSSCLPGNSSKGPAYLLHCSDTAAQGGLGLGIISVLADAIAMVIPMPVVLKLKLPTDKKVGLVVMFMSGIFAVIASSISVYYKWQSKNGSTTNVTTAMVCTMIESCITTMVGCMPATYTLWSQYIPTSSLYARLVSAFSQQSRFSSKKNSHPSMSGKGSNNFKPPASDGSSSTENINVHDFDHQLPRHTPYHHITDEYTGAGVPLAHVTHKPGQAF